MRSGVVHLPASMLELVVILCVLVLLMVTAGYLQLSM